MQVAVHSSTPQKRLASSHTLLPVPPQLRLHTPSTLQLTFATLQASLPPSQRTSQV